MFHVENHAFMCVISSGVQLTRFLKVLKLVLCNGELSFTVLVKKIFRIFLQPFFQQLTYSCTDFGASPVLKNLFSAQKMQPLNLSHSAGVRGSPSAENSPMLLNLSNTKQFSNVSFLMHIL
jgi:hypothetical protein